jgi:hypothetical protein
MEDGTDMGSTRKYDDQINRQANESTSRTGKLFICTSGVIRHPAVREEYGIKQNPNWDGTDWKEVTKTTSN